MATRSLNRAMLIGNLTRDPNLRYTPTGTAVCTFGIATNRSWTPPGGGERQDSVEFHNIVAWRNLADICGQLLHTGDKVYVEGRLQTRDWQTSDGQDRRTTEIVIDNMLLLFSRSGGRGASQSQEYDQHVEQSYDASQDGGDYGYDEGADTADASTDGEADSAASSGRGSRKSGRSRSSSGSKAGSKAGGKGGQRSGKRSGGPSRSQSSTKSGDQDASDAEDIADDIPF